MTRDPLPGDVIELPGIWLDGTETEDHVRRWKDEECGGAIRDFEARHNVIATPITFMMLKPGQDRVPPVPDHISGPDVRLLYGEAKVFAYATVIKPSGIVNDLTPRDVARLRRITREKHQVARPGMPMLTNEECDQIINGLGPDVVLRTLNGDTVN